jgi:hypothetical protein
MYQDSNVLRPGIVFARRVDLEAVMEARIPKQEKPGNELQEAVLEEARERAVQLREAHAKGMTDRSVTPPHGDPEKAHLGRETPATPLNPEEGPGPAEGRTDNKAGG